MNQTNYLLNLILAGLIGGPAAVIGVAAGMASPGWLVITVTLVLVVMVLAVAVVFAICYAAERWRERPSRIAGFRNARERDIERWREKLPTYTPKAYGTD